MNTVNKLKKLIFLPEQKQQQQLIPASAPASASAAPAEHVGCSCIKGTAAVGSQVTPTESSHLNAVLTRCPYHYVNGLQQPLSPGSAPVPVITIPASQTTAQLINATLVAATAVAQTGRFIEYFPPPVPPPQQLQPGFIKYNINYGPRYIVPPCVGPRLYRA